MHNRLVSKAMMAAWSWTKELLPGISVTVGEKVHKAGIEVGFYGNKNVEDTMCLCITTKGFV